MRALLLTLPAIALAGCLGDGGPRRPGPAAVTGSLALNGAQAGPPDAGTATGHGGDAAVGRTRRAWYVLHGSVRPPDADVRILDARYMGLSAVPERRGTAFTARLGPLRPGVNRFVVEATAPGRRPWRLGVRIVREAAARRLPRRVTVPVRDRTPPAAVLRLDRDRLVAVGIGRDAGGLVRIRVSAEMRIACGSGLERRLVLHVPPAMVERPQAAPGARRPTRLRRRVDLGAAAARRCGGPARSVGGRAWAEATDAHGRDGYSAYVPLR